MRKTIIVILTFVCTLLCGVPAFGQSVAQSFFDENKVTKDANVGVMVVDLSTGKTIDSYRETHRLPTASTMKVITTCTALELLGSNYRWSTYLETDGSVVDGVIDGNLYVRGTGDPTLASSKMSGTAFMNAWVDTLRKAGIREITGSVIADLTMWDNDEAANPGWTWDDMGNYYGMGVFPLAYKDNTLRIWLHSGEQGSMATVDSITPAFEGLAVRSSVRCTETKSDDSYVYGIPMDNNRFIKGEIPSNRGSFSVKGDNPNPGLMLVQDFTKALQEAGVAVDCPAGYLAVGDTDYSSRKVIYEHKSATLSDIIYETNQSSNNQYAEMIFRTLGMQAGLPATVGMSREVIRKCWQNRGVRFDAVIQQDGCGLAPQNGVAPATFVSLLRYMWKSKEKKAFLASLPVSGKSGTGKYFLNGTRLEGKVYAKSGTIAHLKSYTGYIFLSDNKIYAFSVVINNGNGSSTTVKHAIENYLLLLTK